MQTTLLQIFSNQDVDWLLTAGKLAEIPSGTILIQPGHLLETLYILLEGELTVSLLDQTEIAWLSAGEMVGALPGLTVDGQFTTVTTATNCQVFTIPQSALLAKCQVDSEFAAHLYRAIAMLLANRLEQLAQQWLEPSQRSYVFNQPQRESIALFAALQDDDLDWLIATGRVQQLATETVLIQSGRPIDAWHILLEGAVTLSTATVELNPLISVFVDEQSSPMDREFARLSRGDTIGELLFIYPSPTTFTATAVRETQVLSIPHWRLAAKLLHDPEFAARFYSVLAVLLINKQQQLMQSGELSQAFDDQFLTQMALAEARFEWMLKRVQTKTMVGGGMRW